MRPRRIVGQCSHTDFADIEHLMVALDNPEMLDTSTLTRKQKFAFYFLAMTQDKGITWKLSREVVKEVLFWGENEDKVTATEVKFFQDRTKLKKIDEFKRLWR